MTPTADTTLGEIVRRTRGVIQTGPFGSQLHASDYRPEGTPLIMPVNIGDNVIYEDGIARIGPEDVKRLARHRLCTGDILFSRRGDVGRRSIVRPEHDGWLCGTGCLAVKFGSMVDGVNPMYVALLIGRPDLQTWLADNAVGGTMPNLNTSILSSLPFYLPPRAQQDAVVQALESAGELVVNLERLIAKKRDVKLGMMQELLTGRPRLPGFAGGWKRACLGDALTVRHGRDQKAVEVVDGRYKILATGGQIGTTNTPLYSKPSVLIGRKGTIDRPQFQDEPFWCVDTLFYTEIRDSADPKYLFYVFQTVDWRSMNEASGVPSLTSGRVESVEVDLPDVDEQRAIRMVLDDADAEIAALERRLESARAVKVGMMQELLTGRTRLSVAEEA